MHTPARLDLPQKVTARVSLLESVRTLGVGKLSLRSSCTRLSQLWFLFVPSLSRASTQVLSFRIPVPWQWCLVLSDSFDFSLEMYRVPTVTLKIFLPFVLVYSFPSHQTLFQLSGSGYKDCFPRGPWWSLLSAILSRIMLLFNPSEL